ncbi:MAG: hypothetical protein JST92_05145 [Deltaproteobacteria bacterium]|nr:hypothetical protein [Deltaproteobacteria bacterium]
MAPRVYPRDVIRELVPRQLYAVARRPPNVDARFQRTFGDLYWKLAGLMHHAQRVLTLEQAEMEATKAALERDPRVVALLESCSSTLRIEYESALSASYSAQNLLSCAVFESLTGKAIEDGDWAPSFSDLVKKLDKNLVTGPARVRVDAAFAELRSWNSPDLFEKLTPRNRIVHREHLQCLPIMASRMRELRIRPDEARELGVDVVQPPGAGLSLGFELLPELGIGTIRVTRGDGTVPGGGPIWISPPREAALASCPILSERAHRLVSEHLMATALLLTAIAEGPDPLSEVLSRVDAAKTAVGLEPDPPPPGP